jgi:hypothetical protein
MPKMSVKANFGRFDQNPRLEIQDPTPSSKPPFQTHAPKPTIHPQGYLLK